MYYSKVRLTMVQLGWIDFSSSDRQKFAAALDLLKPEGMVDELGLGTIRDGLANYLFPGLSTIHTRAKYFFLIPYILYDYEQLARKGRTRLSAIRYLEEQENEIMWNLSEKYRDVKNSGVIGITLKRGQKIVRRPSMIYWNGINTYQFMHTGGLSAPAFLQKSASDHRESLLSELVADGEVNDDRDADYDTLFRIPFAPSPDWRKNLSIELTTEESDFFEHQILSIAPNRMIGKLLNHEELLKTFMASEGFVQFARNAVHQFEDGSLRKSLILAHDFSTLMYGAHATYNVLLQKTAFADHSFESNFQLWLANLRKEMIDFDGFDVATLFSFSKSTRPTTQRFIESWWQLVNKKIFNTKERDLLIEEQEFHVKRNKARIRFKKFDDLQKGRWTGLTFLEFRYRNAKIILSDIRNPLTKNASS